MAIPAISYPSSLSGTNAVKSRDPILQGYIFDAGLQMPEISSILTYLYPQYTSLALFDRLGASSGIQNDTFSWFIQGRTRKSATVSSGVSGLPAASQTLTLDTVATGADLGYFVIGDLVRTENGTILRVNSVGDAGGFQTITVGKPSGSNIAVGDIANAEKIGHLSTSFEEGSTGPKGRFVTPTEEYNYLQIFRRGIKVSGSALDTKSWIDLPGGKRSWFFESEGAMFKEFMADIERNVMFGVRSVSGTRKTSRGIWDRVVTSAEGQIQNFATAGGITETDLQALITKLVRENSSDELFGLCGSEAMNDIHVALKPYAMNGAVQYGSYGSNLAGLKFQEYNYMGKSLKFAHYALFDDAETLPFVTTSTSTKTNFRHAALFLDMGDNGSGEKLISLKHRDGDGGNRKFAHAIVPGMHTGSGTQQGGGFAASTFDGYEVSILSECGVKMMLPNRCGVLLPNS
jgi:hypothetical protein